VLASWKAFYENDVTGVWTLVGLSALLLCALAYRGLPRTGGVEPYATRFVFAWTIVFGLAITFDPIATGKLGWNMIPFVVVGDYRVFALVLVVMQPGRSRASALLEALAWTAIVPAIAIGIDRGDGALMANRPEQSLWIVYESAFALLAIFLMARVVPARVGIERPKVRRYLRAVLALVLLYYVAWATADILIAAGRDIGWLLRFLANLFYYCGFVPAAAWLFFRSAASSSSTQTAR
jgi:hypothetical protein